MQAVNFSKSGEASVVIPKMNITMDLISTLMHVFIIGLKISNSWCVSLAHTNMIYSLGLKSSVHV